LNIDWMVGFKSSTHKSIDKSGRNSSDLCFGQVSQVAVGEKTTCRRHNTSTSTSLIPAALA